MNIEINISEARRALTEKPLFATSAERVLILNEIKSKYNGLPQPKRFEKMLSEFLSEVSVPIEPHDLVAGRCVDRELTEEEEKIFASYLKHPDNPSRLSLLSSGHCTLSWETLVKKGLCGLKDEARASLERFSGDPDKELFLGSMIGVYGAIENYILRYAEAARGKGLFELAENLETAATKAPDSFCSALQLLWIVTLINCAYISSNPTLTVGRLDKILYPLYESDLRSGKLTRERAKEYITDYFCKHNLIMGRGEHQVGDATNSTTFERIFNFDAPQYLLLAGTDENGEPLVNELTELFAECIVPEFKNPVVVVRYFPGLNVHSPHLWATLVKKAMKSASLMFYNDDNVIKTFSRIGLPIEDCRKYEHFGCNWPSLGEDSMWMRNAPRSVKFGVYRSEAEAKYLDIPFMRVNSNLGWADDFMQVMRALEKKPQESISIEDFYEEFFARVNDFLDRKLKHASDELAARQRKPSALLSLRDCFSIGAVRRGECMSASAKYHFELQSFYMFATVADCFTVVDKLVFREKKLTLRELLTAVDANFEGYEAILAMCRGVDKYGTDTPLSNSHVTRLSKRFTDAVIEKSRPYVEKQGLLLVSCMQSDTWHLKYGEQFGATPDGRLAGTPFSQNSRPQNGACTNGLTAMLRSMLCLPSDGLLSGALNLDIDRRTFEGEKGEALLSAALSSYFNAGGLHAQVTYANLDELIDAQKNPALHLDLRVRVTGYSGVFVDICKKLQDDIIERMK